MVLTFQTRVRELAIVAFPIAIKSRLTFMLSLNWLDINVDTGPYAEEAVFLCIAVIVHLEVGFLNSFPFCIVTLMIMEAQKYNTIRCNFPLK